MSDIPPPLGDDDAPDPPPEKPAKPPMRWLRHRRVVAPALGTCAGCEEPYGAGWHVITWVGRREKTDRGVYRTTHDNGVCHPDGSRPT